MCSVKGVSLQELKENIQDACQLMAVGIVEREGEMPTVLQRWAGPNVASDPEVHAEIRAFIQKHKAKSVVITDGVIGCPHEEGIDYPLGEDCPFCPFWKGRQ